jgi:hypothetical protein
MRGAVAALADHILRQERRRRRRRPADAATFSLETELILCNVAALALAKAERLPLAIGRGRGDGRDGSASRNHILDALARGGLLPMLEKGWRGSFTWRPSTWQVTPALRDYLPKRLSLADLEVTRRVERLVLLRDGGHRPLRLPLDAHSLETEMRHINEALWRLPVSLDASAPGAWLTEPKNRTVPLRVETVRHVELYRAFRQNLQHGGRLYGGFWIQKPAPWRFEHMKIAGEPIASCDFRETFLRLAYIRCGVRWPFAPGECGYTAGAGTRDGWKVGTNGLLMAQKAPKRWIGKPGEEQEWLRRQFPVGTAPPSVYAAILARHPELTAAGAFGSGWAALLTRVESDLMVAILLECRASCFPSLPVHDCLLVPASCAGQAAELMEETAARVAGAALPVAVSYVSR